MRPDAAFGVTERARGVRRRLAPVAWVVLEELALDASPAGDVETNVRAISAALGLSKDTVARGLRLLLADALVVRIDARDASTGRFDRGAYRVDLAAAGLTRNRTTPPTAAYTRAPAAPTTTTTTPPSTTDPTSSTPLSTASTHRPDQLPLFTDDPRPRPPNDQPPSTDALAPEVPDPSRSSRASRPPGSSC